LPVRMLNFTAGDFNTHIKLTWSVGDESDIYQYEIQKASVDNNFTTVGSILASGQSKYEFDDNDGDSKIIFYRIKCMSVNTGFCYSKIIAISREREPAQMSVFPNPVTNGDLSISLDKMKQGRYVLNIYNSTGYRVHTQYIDITSDEKLTVSFSSPHVSAKGIYFVQLAGQDKNINCVRVYFK